MSADTITWIFSILAAIILFLHGLSSFSTEITELGGERLRTRLRQLTRTDVRGMITGMAATALVQSSSAITSMAVGLTQNKTLSSRSAFTVMVGANVGTTLTAWLVAFKVAGLGPMFVTLGGLWSFVGPRPWRNYGKAVFYFGLIFLALDWIGEALAPVAVYAQDPQWQTWLQTPWLALLFGIVLTALVQSSSVVSGLAVMATAQGIIDPMSAAWMVAGSNVGSTSTALMASMSMQAISRRLALLNSAVNILGVLLFITALQPLLRWLISLPWEASRQVAVMHSLFNIASAAVVLLLLPYVWPRIHAWLRRQGA